MANELTTSNKSSLAVLNKAKSLLNITNSLLKKEDNQLQNDDWIYRLWKWAYENTIPKLHYNKECEIWEGLPRDKEELLNLEKLNLSYYNFIELPK